MPKRIHSKETCRAVLDMKKCGHRNEYIGEALGLSATQVAGILYAWRRAGSSYSAAKNGRPRKDRAECRRETDFCGRGEAPYMREVELPPAWMGAL